MDRTTSPTTRFDIINFEDLSPENTWTKLGEGSFGSVYRAKYLGLPIAIKEIIQRSDYNVEKYFARECKILQESRHPNIVQYIGLCLAPIGPGSTAVFRLDRASVENPKGRKREAEPEQSRVLIISEYLSKGNLRTYLISHAVSSPPRTFGWRLRISFAIDIARAIAYLHERKCMHRDLKLENCLITENYRIKLCDFGFARLEARNPEEVRRLSYCGTDGYMSPEILRGDPFGLSTDIYSLGVIFCELATLKLAGTSGAGNKSSIFLQRVAPRHSLSAADVRRLLLTQQAGCPEEFVQLSLQCSNVDGARRPKIKEVIRVLDSIEQAIIKQERQSRHHPNDPCPTSRPPESVGSLKFGKSNVKPASRRDFKRMPSFQGQITIPRSTSGTQVKGVPVGLREEDEKASSDRSGPCEAEAGEVCGASGKDLQNRNPSLQSSTSTIQPGEDGTSRNKQPVSDSDHQTTGLMGPLALPIAPAPPSYSTSGHSISTLELTQRIDSSLIPSELGTIPTIQSEMDRFSSAVCTFEVEMKSLTEPDQSIDGVSRINVTSAEVREICHPEEEGSVKFDRAGLSNENDTTRKADARETEEKNDERVTEGITSTTSAGDSETRLYEADLTSPGAQNTVNHSKQPPSQSAEEGAPVKASDPLVGVETLDDILRGTEPLPGIIPERDEQADVPTGQLEGVKPHRFTLIKPNWFATLFSHLHGTKEHVADTKAHKTCAGCKKTIGSTKPFLRCDDCAIKCHRKCGDDGNLSACQEVGK